MHARCTALLAFACLLTVPAVAADHDEWEHCTFDGNVVDRVDCAVENDVPRLLAPFTAAEPDVSCPIDQGVVNSAQCLANYTIDRAEAIAQGTIRSACVLVFGEPC